MEGYLELEELGCPFVVHDVEVALGNLPGISPPSPRIKMPTPVSRTDDQWRQFRGWTLSGTDGVYAVIS